MSVLSATIALGFLLSAFVRPAYAVAAWIGVVSWSAALPWYLTGVNYPWTASALVGLASGLGLRAFTKGHGDRWRQVAPVAILALLLAVPAAIALLSRLPAGGVASSVADALPAALHQWNPGGIAGLVQGALIAVAGPIVAVGVTVLYSENWPVTLGRALGLGVLGVTASPLMGVALTGSWSARPDRGELTGLGLTGLAQDPHAFAASVLLVVIPAAALQRAAGGAAAGPLALGAILMLGCGSEVGLITLLCISACFLRDARARRGQVAAFVGLAAASLAVATAAGAFSTLPGGGRLGAAGQLDRWGLTLELRSASWSRAVAVARSNPLWGIGPGRLPDASVRYAAPFETPPVLLQGHVEGENAHNAVLQVAAESGVFPAIGLAMLLYLSLVAVARGNPWRLGGVAAAATMTVAATAIFGLGAHPLLLAEIQGMVWIWIGLALATSGIRFGAREFRLTMVMALTAVLASVYLSSVMPAG